MPELDQMSPEMEPQQPEMGAPVMGLEPGQTDEEGAMAKADLYKLANYSFKLFKKLEDDAQLEGWVQAKITKAADYIASVYHYLEYEMEFSQYGHKLDNSDVMNESQKTVLKNKLMEAKAKIKALKVTQAEKAKEKKVDEGIFGGHEESCTECGGTGMVRMPERQVPETVKTKVATYNRQAKAFHAASKRIDKNKNGIPDSMEKGGEELTAEEMSSTGGTITREKGKLRHSHNPKRFTDEPHTEPKSKAQSKSSADKAGDRAADKQTEKDSKDYEKRFPGSVTKVEQGKKVDPNAPKKKKEEEVDETQGGHSFGQGVYEGKGKKPDFLDMDKDGDKKEPMKKAVADKKAGPKKGVNPFAKKNEGIVDTVVKGAVGLLKKTPLTTAEKNAAAHAANKGKNMPSSGNALDDYDYSTGRDKVLGGEKDVKEAKEEKFDALKHVKKPTKGEKDAAKDVKRGNYGDRAAMLKSAEADGRLKKESYVKQAVAEAKKNADNKKPDFLDMDKDGDKKEPMKKAVADKKEVVKESSDLARMRELSGRLNLNENVIVKQLNEVDQLRALTKRLLG